MTEFHTSSAPTYSSLDVRFVRDIFFLIAFVLFWISAEPFPDLSDPRILEPIGGGDLLNQLTELALTTAFAFFVLKTDSRIVLKAVTPLLVLTLLWFALSIVFADYPALAGRRFVLAIFTIFNAAAFLTLPRDTKHLATLLAVSVLALLTVSYLSVLIIPDRAIHQATDLLDADLVGAWRGPFGHKNGAGAAMVIFIFIGIFIGRTLNGLLGTVIALLAGFFLIFTRAKTPINLLPVILALTYIIPRIENRVCRFLSIIAAPIAINLLTIGSVCFRPIWHLLNLMPIDPSFTNRDEIWRFTLQQIAERPFFGFGFQAYWNTANLMIGSPARDWVTRMSDAHNGLLNLAVMTGIGGAAIAAVWLLLQPTFDYMRSPLPTHPMTTLFLQIWLFVLCQSGLESTLFAGGNGMWFMALVSLFGLRFQRIASWVG